MEPEIFANKIYQDRQKALGKYSCPLCQSKNLKLRKGFYTLTQHNTHEVVENDELTTLLTEQENTIKSSPIVAKDRPNVRVADCGNCGYILMFQNGFGPT